MASTRQFCNEVLGRLMPFGPVTARAMFGGYGLYLDGTMFALIARDRLYFKVDESMRRVYEAAGTEAFRYDGRYGPVTMSYHAVPSEVYADPGRLTEWAGEAYQIARRSRRRKSGRRKGDR